MAKKLGPSQVLFLPKFLTLTAVPATFFLIQQNRF
jgi:hypothetical protein|tara:strand:+ start:261 stop:365 length:105 start_codon:yes stop_codon:yes gene_type:complete